MQEELNFGCSEQFAKLCALSTSGLLTAADEERLEAHVAVCAECALLLNQYRTLATAGMAKLAALWTDSGNLGEKLQNADHVKAKLFSALEPLQAAHAGGAGKHKRRGALIERMRAWHLSAVAALAAMLLVALASRYPGDAVYPVHEAWLRMAHSVGAESPLRTQLAETRSQLASVKEELLAATYASEILEARSARAKKEVKDLKDSKAALQARIQALATDSQRQNTSVASLTAERDALAQRLRDSEASAQSVRQELKAAQDDRQHALLAAASLETQVDRLSAQMREREEAARRNEQYLASDRDIRELMGARQLYIADVFDVDAQGKTRTPFGRVFYTKGKSLIFYAFDLDQQPGYREAKAFQAWGRLDSGQTTPVNLGIFYLDSETQRRWALKFEDPKVLEEINAVFVTVEPKGGSKRPTNKPFLLTYLHTTTLNHP